MAKKKNRRGKDRVSMRVGKKPDAESARGGIGGVRGGCQCVTVVRRGLGG